MLAAARGCGAASGAIGVSKAMPPTSTVAIDCVLRRTPVASSERSTPLAFQKRELAVTNWPKGESTNTVTSTCLPSLATSVETTWPAVTPRK